MAAMNTASVRFHFHVRPKPLWQWVAKFRISYLQYPVFRVLEMRDLNSQPIKIWRGIYFDFELYSKSNKTYSRRQFGLQLGEIESRVVKHIIAVCQILQTKWAKKQAF